MADVTRSMEGRLWVESPVQVHGSEGGGPGSTELTSTVAAALERHVESLVAALGTFKKESAS